MWYLFLINPFSAFLYALFNLKQKHAKNVLWFFIIFIGLTWSLREDANSDSVRYMQRVYDMNHSTIGFFEYYEQSGDIDFLSHLIAYTVSRFTDIGAVIMIVYGLTYGFFFSRNMAFVQEKLEGKIKPITWILFLVFFVVVAMWNFNGFRFWTAAHIFIYGLLPFLFEGNKKKLIWCFLTPFVVHFAFVVPVAILLLYMVLGNRVRLYFGMFVFSLFFAEFDLQQFNALAEQYVPEKFLERSDGYRSEAYFERIQEQREAGIFSGFKSWHSLLYQKALMWSIYVFIFYFFFKRKAMFDINKRMIFIFSFVLLFGSFANFLSNLPSGGRYMAISNLLTLSFVIIYIQNLKQDDRLSKLIVKAVIPMLLFYFVVSAREGFYYLSVTTIIGNPIIAMLSIGNNINLDSLIK